MTEQQKELAHTAWWWCDEEDKSTEFMLAYISDVAGINYDTTVDFVCHTSFNERLKYRGLPPQPQKEFNEPLTGGDKLIGMWADVTVKKPNTTHTARAKIIKYKRYHKRSNNKYLVKFDGKLGEQYVKFSQMSNLTPYKDKDKKLTDESKS